MPFTGDWGQVHNVPIRPLSKGMIKNLPSNAVPAGGFLELKNFKATDTGLQKRGGFIPFNINDFDVVSDYVYSNEYYDFNSKLSDVIFFWRPDDDPEAFIITATQLWGLKENNLLSEKELTSAITAAEITSYTVTLNTVEIITTLTAQGLWRKGDYIELDAVSGFKGKITFARIEGGFLTLSVDFGFTPPASGDITGYHQLVTDDIFGVDWTVTPGYDNKVILTDSSYRGIYEYDGNSLSMMTITNGTSDPVEDPLLDAAKICTVFSDRLWVANTLEETGTKKFVQRIRWSQPASFSYFRDTDFLDLPYSDGEILKLVPMGSLLVVYCEDAIYFGRQTNVAGLPYTFTRMETGGIGPVSQRAIQPWVDGHFFVANDDVYWFNATTSLQAITTPILKDTIEVTQKVNMLKYIEVSHDPLNEQLLFLFPDVPESQFEYKGLATKIWALNTKTKGWSFYDVAKANGSPLYYFTTVSASRYFALDKDWNDWITQEDVDGEEVDWIDSDLTFVEQWFSKNTWHDLGSSVYLDKTMFIGIAYIRSPSIDIPSQWTQGLYYEGLNATDNIDALRSYSVATAIESPDYDFNTPDTVKTVTRNSLKCWEQPQENLEFQMQVSDDRGLTWKTLPNIVWNPRSDEGRADYRSTGTNYRFRIFSEQETHPYIITEMVLRVAGRGLQTDV